MRKNIYLYAEPAILILYVFLAVVPPWKQVVVTLETEEIIHEDLVAPSTNNNTGCVRKVWMC